MLHLQIVIYAHPALLNLWTNHLLVILANLEHLQTFRDLARVLNVILVHIAIPVLARIARAVDWDHFQIFQVLFIVLDVLLVNIKIFWVKIHAFHVPRVPLQIIHSLVIANHVLMGILQMAQLVP